jgi:hypothetical protein
MIVRIWRRCIEECSSYGSHSLAWRRSDCGSGPQSGHARAEYGNGEGIDLKDLLKADGRCRCANPGSTNVESQSLL